MVATLDADACTSPECVLSADAEAIAPDVHAWYAFSVESTSDTHLLAARSPTYVTSMFATCGSLFTAAATFSLVIVRVGDPYCRLVIFEIVSLMPASTHVALVSPPASV